MSQHLAFDHASRFSISMADWSSGHPEIKPSAVDSRERTASGGGFDAYSLGHAA